MREILDSNGSIFYEFKPRSNKKHPKVDNHPRCNSNPNYHSDQTTTTIRYFINTANLNDDYVEKEIQMEKGATVKLFKEKISKLNDNASPSNMKVLFVGKEISDETILSDLEIGDCPIYVYIRFDRSNYLFEMTAKALRVDLDHDDDDDEFWK